MKTPTPDRGVEEIYKKVRSNGRAILYSDLIGLGVENERKQCGRDDMWAITTEELELLTKHMNQFIIENFSLRETKKRLLGILAE